MPFRKHNPLLAEASLTDLPESGLLDSEPGITVVPTEAMVRHESMLINEVCLILAEKRTALSVMRTGLAILVLPLSVASVLIAISRYYDPGKVIYLLGPLLGISLLLAVFGFYLIFYSWRRSRNLEAISRGLKRQNPQLSKLCDLVERGRRPL
ncbi:MAG: DUF202 domain-containing protein [Deltaproteobacteria bacterium]|nr:DUF202 domain-containing protein [Deltaproteobacteria bacterium]